VGDDTCSMYTEAQRGLDVCRRVGGRCMHVCVHVCGEGRGSVWLCAGRLLKGDMDRDPELELYFGEYTN
jgi:hypothetical protein